jgi:hypothetical protein
MVKHEMVTRTVEGFIRKLQKEGLEKYATELRAVIAMSRERREAVMALSVMTIPLLEHLVKYIALSNARERNKWVGEIKGYLRKFNIRNKGPKGLPWLSIEYIKRDLNHVLSQPEFLIDIKEELNNVVDRNKVLSLLEIQRTLKNLGITLLFDSSNNLNLSINNKLL